MSIEPPQSPIQPFGGNLDHQRQSLRRRRQVRYSRNPIAHSPQYQAYRARQSRDGNQEDAKWPEILEIAFLDALVDIPPMGRRKFSYKGKPHGRNELIKEYIWIAYLQSLAPGQRPDPFMARDRKQVSSHIQVLKGFLKDHPAFARLFPSNKTPKDGLEDSFKNDPCLRALSQGRLPTRRYERFNERFNEFDEMPPKRPQTSVKPANFWLLVTSAKIQDDCGDLYEKGIVTHRYSRLSSQTHHSTLDSIPNWSQKFPYLEPFYNNGELDCEIIHMDVSLNLMDTHAQDGADLVTRSEISVTGYNNEKCEWQTVTSLIKPQELCREYSSEMHLEAHIAPTKILLAHAGETRLKVRFPAEEWAHIFTCLTDLQLKYEESKGNHAFGDESFMSSVRPAHEFLEQISMYQEIQSCSRPGTPFTRRAIILWTFREAMPRECSETTWRYVDATSSHRYLSPSSHSSRQLSTTTNDSFNAWVDSPSQPQLQQHDLLDPYVHGLVTPPSTAGLRSTFTEGHGYHDQQFDATPENFGFGSTTTASNESALVGNNITRNIDAYLSNTANVRMTSVDHNPPDWDMNYTELLNPGPAWANYAAIPSNASHFEDESNATNQPWNMDMDPRLNDWTEADATNQKQIYIEQSDNKLLPWLDPLNSETKGIYAEADSIQLPKLSPGPTDTKDTTWIGSDSSFDFNQMVERLKT